MTDDVLDEQFRAIARRLPGGGTHVDTFAVHDEWRSLVGDADVEQYESDRWRAGVADEVARSGRESSETLPHCDTAYWVDDPLAAAEQWAGYRYLARGVTTGPVVQIGGRGIGLIRWLRASGRPGFLVSPFEAELAYGRALADRLGVGGQLTTVVAPVERLPFVGGSVATVFAPGVMHHTQVADGLREICRVLVPGGRFASWDIWDSPMYRVGIRAMGKSEDIACVPLDRERLSDLPADLDVQITHGGGLARYVAAALSRLGRRLPIGLVLRMGAFDRALARVLPLRSVSASTVSVHAERRDSGQSRP